MSENKRKGGTSKTRKNYTEYNIWTYNDESNIEMISLPIGLKSEFVSRFGVEELANTTEVLDWINSFNL